MRDRTIPIHAGCFSRECQSAFVAGLIKGSTVAVSLIVERYLDGLDFAAANELVTDSLGHRSCRFYLQDGSDNGRDLCAACGRLMPPM